MRYEIREHPVLGMWYVHDFETNQTVFIGTYEECVVEVERLEG